jgi:membrane associated rhomboid family serine protease
MPDFAQAPAAYAILGLFVVVSMIGLNGSPQLIERNLLWPFRVVRKHEYGPIISSGFIHADGMHLLMNGITMFAFGPALEATVGTVRFVVLYFLALVLSSLGTVWKHRANPDYASLGASGAIMAVMFAFIVYYPTSTILLFFALPVPAALYAVAFVVYSVWAAKRGRDRINHGAHLDGALIGLLFVAVTDFRMWRYAFERLLG